jgi:hypothetical protein
MTRNRHPRTSNGRVGRNVWRAGVKASVYRVGAQPGHLFYPCWGTSREANLPSNGYGLQTGFHYGACGLETIRNVEALPKKTRYPVSLSKVKAP